MKRRRFARAPRTRRVAGVMNKGEQAYHDFLTMQQKSGHVLEFGYETVTCKLATDCRITPDFFVVNGDGEVEMHEVKPKKKGGKWFAREDAMVKLKTLASQFPFRVYVVWPDQNYLHWNREEVA
jgi:hypothetical protein